MNIAIVTLPILNNYGGLLQNYALQTILHKLGHNPITLNYIPHKSWIRVLASFALTPIFFFTSKRRTLSSCLPVKRDCKIANFIKHRLNFSRRLYNYDSSILQEYNIEGVVVGSDQVWRPKYNSSVIEDNFLAFASGSNIKRLSYAASFGTSNWEYDDDLTNKCSVLALEFDAISVRENDAVDMCKKFLSINAIEVLDPTLLLKEEDYNLLLPQKQIRKEGYIATYILDRSQSKELLITKFCRHRGLQRKSISVTRKLKHSVEEWLDLIRGANLVITDSFHGMVFSIIFNKDFYVIENNNRGIARMQSILSKLGLMNHYISKTDDISIINSQEPIDWKKVNTTLEQLRKNSIEFLKQNLY